MSFLAQVCFCRRVRGQLCSERSAGKTSPLRSGASRDERRRVSKGARQKYGAAEPSMPHGSSSSDMPFRAERRDSPVHSPRLQDRKPLAGSLVRLDGPMAVTPPREGDPAAMGDASSPGHHNRHNKSHDHVKELQDLARQLMGPVEKYPSQGMKFIGGVKKRYLAVIPEGDFQAAGARQWRHGVLGWWESEAAYLGNQQPKGSMPLMKISKVKHLRDQCEGRAVEVKHTEDTEAESMIILLKTARGATEWSVEARQFLCMLRDQKCCD